MIIGITGARQAPDGKYFGMKATGKDTVASILIKDHGFISMALADPIKRICQQVYDFSDEQLWGPSEKREEPDKRYLRRGAGYREDRSVHLEVDPETGEEHYVPGEVFRTEWEDEYLTTRFACQTLGTEWGRTCYNNTWVDLLIRTYNRLQTKSCYYDQRSGLRPWSSTGMANAKTNVVVPDVRFKNEIEAIQKAGGKVIRVIRPGDYPVHVDMHPSEQEALSIPDSAFDTIILNDGDLYLLELRTKSAFDVLSGRILPYDDEQKDVPPFLREKK